MWASELDDFPATVTAHHFPDMVQLGDITKINVDELTPVDIICAGSPCQDLSVAGKREGLAGERSGLFRTAIELVHGLRKRTGSPRYFVWENVPGAFSSNKGLDFRAVLEEVSQTSIPMPTNNKWAEAGMVEWAGGSLAWRVLDAQYWGVPQRRKRIFLVADFGGQSAGEILFEPKGLSGDSAESEGEGQETAGNAGTSVDSASGTLTPWDVQSNRIQSIYGTAAALYGGAGQGTHNGAVFDTRAGKGIDSASGFKYRQGAKAGNIGYQNGKAPTLELSQNCAVYDMTHADEVMRPVTGDKSNCLNSRMGTGGNQVPVVHSYCIAGNTIDRKPQNGGNGNGNQAELAYTLNTVDRHAVAYSMGHDERSAQFTPNKTDPLTASDYKQPPIVGALCARDYKGVGNQFVDEGKIVVGSLCAHDGRGFNGQDVQQNKIVYPAGKVRRLTPTECERLQGLPDGYTDIEFNGKPTPDSRRYKALGNGMAQPCADYVIKRIVDTYIGNA
mgnify:CR=1 FL=1